MEAVRNIFWDEFMALLKFTVRWLTVIYGIGKSIKMHHAHLAALWLEGLSLGSNVLTFCLFRLQCLFQTFPQTNIQKKQGLLCCLV
jgi:hypothetical protein